MARKLTAVEVHELVNMSYNTRDWVMTEYLRQPRTIEEAQLANIIADKVVERIKEEIEFHTEDDSDE